MIKVGNLSTTLASVKKYRETHNLSPIINLTLGQPHLPINPKIASKLQELLKTSSNKQIFGYSNIAGRPKTLDAIAKLMQCYFPQINCTPSNVICTNGANQANWNALNVILKKGNALCFAPLFPQYQTQVEALGARLITIDISNKDFKVDIEQIEDEIKNNNISCFILNNPINPSGYVWTREELRKLADILLKYPSVSILQDEVYRELSYKEFHSLLDIEPLLFSRCITTFSCSKSLIGAPDLRIGMAFAPENIIAQMTHSQVMVSGEVNLLSQFSLQIAIEEKLSNSQPYRKWMSKTINDYRTNIDYLVNELKNEPNIIIQEDINAGFFMLVNFNKLLNQPIPVHIQESIKLFDNNISIIDSDLTICKILLYHYGLSVVPCSSLGIKAESGIIRISMAADFDEIKLLTSILKKFAQQFNSIASPKQTKNIAFIGFGNIGEWLMNGLIQDMLEQKLNIDRIYLISKNKPKIEARYSDQLHALLLQYMTKSTESNIEVIKIIEKIHYTDSYEKLENVDFIITAFGAPMDKTINTRADLLNANVLIAKKIGAEIKKYAKPTCKIINIANPLDVITWHLADATNIPKNQILGVSANLDITRLMQGINTIAQIPYEDIDISNIAVIGEHGPNMLPVLEKITIKGQKLLKLLNQDQQQLLIEYTKDKGSLIMFQLNRIPPHIAPAKAALSLLKDWISGDEKKTNFCSAWNEEYNVFIGCQIKFKKDNYIVTNYINSLSEKTQGYFKNAVEAIYNNYEQSKNISMKETIQEKANVS